MAQSQQNKTPASINLTGDAAEFKERGNRNIVSVTPAQEFRDYFQNSIIKYGFFCDFSEDHPWDITPSAGFAEVAASAWVEAMNPMTIPGFVGTATSTIDGVNFQGVISQFVPFLVAYDVATGLRTSAFTAQLQVYNNDVLIGWFGGDNGTAPDAGVAGGIFTSAIAAGMNPGGTPGTAIDPALSVKYKLVFKATPDAIRVEAFGMMYDVSVVSMI